MDIVSPTPLLGGLSAGDFMRRHWQKKPLLVRAALPAAQGLLRRAELFALAQRDDVESRLVVRDGAHWTVRRGPLPRRRLPPLAQPGWTLLVQGVDLHLDAAHGLLQRFRFVPDARLDDVMVSYATDGGGVGPHLDSYDVFLLQLEGRRHWRIGPVPDPVLRDDAPLKLLARFDATEAWLLEPGDLLYLPPGWGHEGIARGETLTASIGFRAEGRAELATDLLQRLVDGVEPEPDAPRYADPEQPATDAPGRIPVALQRFATAAVQRLIDDPDALALALGEALSEPKRGVGFDADADADAAPRDGVRLDRRSRMLYDDRHVYLNGEAFRAGGRDAKIVRRLADRRRLHHADVAALSVEAKALLAGWCAAGWLHDEARGDDAGADDGATVEDDDNDRDRDRGRGQDRKDERGARR